MSGREFKLIVFIALQDFFVINYKEKISENLLFKYLGLKPTDLYSSSSICMLPPPQLAPIKNPAERDDNNCAQIMSVSKSSSDDWRLLNC
jgi:hypothetical protein